MSKLFKSTLFRILKFVIFIEVLVARIRYLLIELQAWYTEGTFSVRRAEMAEWSTEHFFFETKAYITQVNSIVLAQQSFKLKMLTLPKKKK